MAKHYPALMMRSVVVIIFFVFVFFIFKIAYDQAGPTSSTLPRMPPVQDPNNIYSAANVNNFSPAVRLALPRVYVPNSRDNTVSVIDPHSYQVVDTFAVGKEPQHIVPSYDLHVLWALNDKSNSATSIDPLTAKPGATVPVNDPYNLYFTPDGQFAIVVAEALNRLDFYTPNLLKWIESVPVQCKGVNHIDFTADGKFGFATCEFSGQLLKFDVASHKVIAYLALHTDANRHSSMPQDIRLSPSGHFFYVADMKMNGVFLIDVATFRVIGFITTGIGTHSIYPSRDGKFFYVANRGCSTMSRCPALGQGSITVLDPTTGKIMATWPILGGGSPDMGNVSADGKELWLSGRYDKEVYVFDTTTGSLTHRIPVGHGPHGLTVWPQPGRYSLGHTGNMR